MSHLTHVTLPQSTIQRDMSLPLLWSHTICYLWQHYLKHNVLNTTNSQSRVMSHNTTKHKPRTHNYWSTEVRHYLIIIMANQTEMDMEGEGGDEVHEPTTYANNRSSGSRTCWRPSRRWNFGVTSWGSTYVSREGSWWKVLQPVARVCVRTGIYCWELKFPAFFVNADYLQRVQTTLCKCMHIILWTSVWQYIVVCC